MLKGIDVSHYNGTPDFSKAKDAGVSFVYVKATEGTKYADPMFQPNMFNAMRAGLPVGAYHFARPDNRPEDEANHFVDTISIFKYNLLPVLDLEWAPVGMTGEQLYQWARKFVEIVQKRTGHQVMLYTGVWFLQKYPALKKLNDLPLWIAVYGRPNVPIAATGWKEWTVWQFTDRDMIPGVGRCDADYVKDLNAIMIDGGRKPTLMKKASEFVKRAASKPATSKPAHKKALVPEKPTAPMYRVIVDGKAVVDTAYPEKIAAAVENAIKAHAKKIIIKPRV